MQITGRIYEIIKINEKVIQIVLRKKDRGKYEFSALTLFGYWKDKAIEQELRPKDKIRANFRIRSNEYNGRYYSEAMCREIYIIEKAPYKVDITTGELF